MKFKEITIKAKIPERWVNDFCSMLKYMERCGNIGHSSLVGFYADGDGDFKPKFEFDEPYMKTDGISAERITQLPEVMFDAG